jgi:RNA polymerase sigma factor (sigma-70 family)
VIEAAVDNQKTIVRCLENHLRHGVTVPLQRVVCRVLLKLAPDRLLKGLFGKSEACRHAVARFLTGNPNADPDRTLAAVMRRAKGDLQIAAYVVWGQTTDNVRRVAEMVATGLKYPGWSVRRRACCWMERLLPQCRVLLEPLRERLTSIGDDVGVAESLKAAMRNVDEGELALLPVLLELLKDDDPTVRETALDTIARFGPKARDALGDVTRMLRDRDEGVCGRAIECVRAIKEERAIPQLIACISSLEWSAEGELLLMAAKGALELGAREEETEYEVASRTYLHDDYENEIECLLSENVRDRFLLECIERVTFWDEEKVLGMLERSLEGTGAALTDECAKLASLRAGLEARLPTVRMTAAEMARRLGERARAVVPELLMHGRDSVAEVRSAVKDALSEVDVEGLIGKRRLKHALIPLLFDPRATAEELFAVLAEDSWLESEFVKISASYARAGVVGKCVEELKTGFLVDLCEETFVKNRTLHFNVRRHREFGGWLTQQFRNWLNSRHRYWRLRLQRECQVAEEFWHTQRGEPNANADTEDRDLMDAVHKYIDENLDSLDREILLARFSEDLRYREISGRVGKSISTVRNRALDALADVQCHFGVSDS